MSPMQNGRGVAEDGGRAMDLRARRKRRVLPLGAPRQENFVQAFMDALRDILHDEMRPLA
jgi:hypothetical protein